MKTKTPFINLNEENLLKTLKQEKRPLRLNELEENLHLTKEDRRKLKSLIRNMSKEGSIIKLKNKRVGIPHEMNLQTGTLWCTKSGNGFVIPDKEGEKDIFVSFRFIKNALHGDRVIVRIDHRGRHVREGKVIKVTDRKMHTVTGFIKPYKNLLYLFPDDERVSHRFIVEQPLKGIMLKENALVACRITKYPEERKDPECKIIKVFNELNDTKSISLFVTHKFDLPARFKKAINADLKQIGLDVVQNGRKDLRTKKFVTIDGEFAKDFDDAVYVEKTNKGYTLFVSIADVSHYVKIDSSLDREAYARGTSIYFPGSVIPMLPKELSNGICSLNPNDDRYAVTVQLDFNRDGDLEKTSFYTSTIRSMMRLTYNKVEDAIVKGDQAVRKDIRPVLPELEYMGELAKLLRGKRERRGNLDFDLPEPEVVLDIEGGVRSILRAERLFSHRIIEEFMISANEAVAKFISNKNIPLIYRIHEHPEREKLINFEKLLYALRIEHERVTKNPLSLQSILKKVRETEYEFLVNRVLLRSMKQAKYSAFNKGHFGLGLDTYLHFTSPIRRYPDLICHRILKNIINGGYRYNEKELERMAIHLSERERIAMDAEREIEDRIRVLFMKDRLGEVYDGIISHITSYGFFVELSDVFVEGLVFLSGLSDDYYAFQEEKFRLIGRRTRKIYRLGDKVKIRVVMADVEKNQLHFALIPG